MTGVELAGTASNALVGCCFLYFAVLVATTSRDRRAPLPPALSVALTAMSALLFAAIGAEALADAYHQAFRPDLAPTIASWPMIMGDLVQAAASLVAGGLATLSRRYVVLRVARRRARPGG